MMLGIRFLTEVADCNSYRMTGTPGWQEGDPCDFYFQLVDEGADGSFGPAGRRYMPEDEATLEVVFANLDGAKVVTRTAEQPFEEDPSIWLVNILAADTIRGTPTMRVALTEDAVVRRVNVQGKIRVRSNSAT